MAKITDWVQDAIKRGKGKEQIFNFIEFVKVENEMTNGFHYFMIKNDLYKNKAFIRVLRVLITLCFREKK
tara:strand:+ start:772 stop:981 length:210 start_codon:yes stop_codon:yes gene_type:complete